MNLSPSCALFCHPRRPANRKCAGDGRAGRADRMGRRQQLMALRYAHAPFPAPCVRGAPPLLSPRLPSVTPPSTPPGTPMRPTSLTTPRLLCRGALPAGWLTRGGARAVWGAGGAARAPRPVFVAARADALCGARRLPPAAARWARLHSDATPTAAGLAAREAGEKAAAADLKAGKGVPATAVQLPAVYFEMGKGKLSALVTLTAAAGYAVAVPVGTPMMWDALVITSGGTMLAAMSASAFNQIVERENDSRMTRTSRRPLVTGKITPQHAYAAASAAGIGGVALLALQINPVTAALGAANIGLYTLVYTPMKQRSHWNTWVGAVVGAIPPMMGWAAATGNVGVGALVMGGVLFSWQMPHFLSLAYMMRKDYKAGGYIMMPGEAGSPELARATLASMRHCVYLEILCASTPFLGMADYMFVAEATALNAAFLYLAYQFHAHGAAGNQGQTNSSARKLFLGSLLYLPLLLGCLVFHRSGTAGGTAGHCIAGAHPGATPGCCVFVRVCAPACAAQGDAGLTRVAGVVWCRRGVPLPGCKQDSV